MIIDIIIIRNEFFKERQKKFVCYYDYLHINWKIWTLEVQIVICFWWKQ